MNHELFTIRYLAEQRSEQLMRESAQPQSTGRPSSRPARRGGRIWRRWLRRRLVPQAGGAPLVAGR